MKKRIIVFVLCLAVLFSAVGVLAGAAIASADDITADDVRFLRGYTGAKGDWSMSGKKINLNGSGVVSTAQKITWDPSNTAEKGICFTITYNDDYTSLGDNFEDYRFAVALMDSQNFQGDTAGHGLGVEWRLINKSGTIRNMGFYYNGEQNTSLQYPGRNSTFSLAATKGKSFPFKIVLNNNTWIVYTDKNGDGTIEAEVARFSSSDAGFPTDLASGGSAYVVFGAYNAQNINVSLSIDSVYGGFAVSNDQTYPTDTVTRVGENMALEDNLLMRFHVEYSSYDMIAKGGLVNISYGSKTVSYDLGDGERVEGLKYAYTAPIPPAMAGENITISITPPNPEAPAWETLSYSTSVNGYLTALDATLDGKSDATSVALGELIASITDYCNKAKIYFDLVG